MGNYFEAKQKEELDSGLLFLLKDDQPDQNLNRYKFFYPLFYSF